MRLLSAIRNCFLRPTAKQRDAYGRFSPTLAAASVIGAFTIAWTVDGRGLQAVWHALALGTLGLLLFIVGSLMFGTEVY